MEFSELNLDDELLRAIERMGFEHPTRIQELSIPHVLAGEDVLAGSATGSGKTLAFGAGIIHNVVAGEGIQGLILTPTRELADQVADQIREFSRFKPLSITTVYGGVAIEPQMAKLRLADVVVGTPGRILDHLERGTIDLSKVRYFVLDEADRMLDMGFIDDVKRIMSQCPDEKQSLLFSATLHPEIVYISQEFMRDPAEVSVDSYVDPSKLHQVYYDISDKGKFSLLVHLLKDEHSGLVMVFCNSRTQVDFVANNLKANGIKALAIHGGFTQDKRSKTMETFANEDVSVLVCTDVAARGLDIEGISHVYNYDAPKEPRQYVHRIGRTARAGHEGIAINLIAPRDHENFDRVLQYNAVDVERRETPEHRRARITWFPEPRSGRGLGPRDDDRRGPPGGRRRGPSSHGPRRRGSGHRPRGAPKKEQE